MNKERYELVQGWFGWADLYDRIIEEATGIISVVEIGIWQGKSTIYLANKIKETEKDVFFYAFDTFEGSPEHRAEIKSMEGRGTSLESIFRKNLEDCECGDYVRAIKQDSVTASKRFQDNSIDFVFLDGGHEYETVKADLMAWIPKVRPGGLIAGDDYAPEWPGVRQAVDELLPGRLTPKWWECQL